MLWSYSQLDCYIKINFFLIFRFTLFHSNAQKLSNKNEKRLKCGVFKNILEIPRNSNIQRSFKQTKPQINKAMNGHYCSAPSWNFCHRQCERITPPNVRSAKSCLLLLNETLVDFTIIFLEVEFRMSFHGVSYYTTREDFWDLS